MVGVSVVEGTHSSNGEPLGVELSIKRGMAGTSMGKGRGWLMGPFCILCLKQVPTCCKGQGSLAAKAPLLQGPSCCKGQGSPSEGAPLSAPPVSECLQLPSCDVPSSIVYARACLSSRRGFVHVCACMLYIYACVHVCVCRTEVRGCVCARTRVCHQ